MSFWESPVVVTTLVILALLAAAEVLRWAIAPMRRLGVPGSIVAGTLGLALGPSGLDVLPIDREVLETGVYHGLAIVFIATALQTPPKGRVGPGVRSMAFGITSMVALQTMIGLALVLLLDRLVSPTHPGFGLLLPMGFEQGPGQALSLGAAWEQTGMPDGAQVGLIIAALGFAWSIVVGVPLVVWGRARGLVAPAPTADTAQAGHADADVLPAGALEVLTRQVAVIGMVYIATWAVCWGFAAALSSMPGIAAMAWGFHFIVGALLAMGARSLLNRLPSGTPIHDGLMSRIGSGTVDLITCGALCAVQVGVLGSHLLPILLISTIGGLITTAYIVWIARRAYPEAPFEHMVLWYGMSTGTLPMGLSLLRMIDPDLRSPAPISAVLGSAASTIGVAPIVLGIIPIPIVGWPEAWPISGLQALGLVTVYWIGTHLVWWRSGGLTLRPA